MNLTPPSSEQAEAMYAEAFSLFCQGQFSKAAQMCDTLMEHFPDNPILLNFRGNIHLQTGELETALTVVKRAIERAPEDPLNHMACAAILEHMAKEGCGRFEDALASVERAMELDPNRADAHHARGHLLQRLNRHDEAASCFEQAVRLNPSHEMAQFNLASLRALAAPSGAPHRYVAALFNDYATIFDEHLTKTLQYATPSLLLDQLKRHGASSELDILDLGCGTGLSGIGLKPLARTLDGVDLSEKMIAEARKKNVYSDLRVNDIITYLGESEKQYDLITAVDVFVYLGELEQVFNFASQRLKDAGFFSFSIENTAAQRFALKPTRRYGHALPYILELAHRHHLEIVEIQRIVLRTENTRPLYGYAILLNKPTLATDSQPSPLPQ
jgi:predicted TPR repeat methyltransferase